MNHAGVERARAVAQSLVELLSSYEEELIALERDAPVIVQLRRAIGMSIAEACYLITDETSSIAEWMPGASRAARRPS